MFWDDAANFAQKTLCNIVRGGPHTYTHINTHTNKHNITTHIYTHTHLCTRTHTYIENHIYTHTHMKHSLIYSKTITNAHICVILNTHIYTSVQYKYVQKQAYADTYTNSLIHYKHSLA